MALFYNGVNNYTSIPYNSSYQSGSFSLVWWQKRSGNVTQNYPGVISHTNLLNGANQLPGISVLMIPSTGGVDANKTYFQINDGTTGAGGFELVAGNDDVWHCYGVVIDRGSGKISFFKDGRLQSEGTGVPPGITVTRDIEIGRRAATGLEGGFVYATTQIDDIRLYNRPLTAQEIRQMYIGGRGFGLLPERRRRRGKAAAGFKAYWHRRQSQLIGGGL